MKFSYYKLMIHNCKNLHLICSQSSIARTLILWSKNPGSLQEEGTLLMATEGLEYFLQKDPASNATNFSSALSFSSSPTIDLYCLIEQNWFWMALWHKLIQAEVTNIAEWAHLHIKEKGINAFRWEVRRKVQIHDCPWHSL